MNFTVGTTVDKSFVDENRVSTLPQERERIHSSYNNLMIPKEIPYHQFLCLQRELSQPTFDHFTGYSGPPRVTEIQSHSVGNMVP